MLLWIAYGKSLGTLHFSPKGQNVQNIAQALKEKVLAYYGTSRYENDTTTLEDFQKDFKECLHRDDALIGAHRAAWKPILANILLVLTGIGSVALAVKAAYQAGQNKPYTINNYLFWAQTKSEQKIAVIDSLLPVLGK